MNRVNYELKLARADNDLAWETIRKALESMLENQKENISAAEFATRVHKEVNKAIGIKNMYQELKAKGNEVALSLLPKVQKIVDQAENAFESAALASVCGNAFDFGIDGSEKTPESLRREFFQLYKMGFWHSDLDKLKQLVKIKKEILYFADNTGEIVFDRIFCSEIKKASPGSKLILVVKKDPVLNDATAEDIKGLGFEDTVDEILDTGCYAIGVNFECINEKLRSYLDSALIISKGMANYEAFSETDYVPIAYLLRIKCMTISDALGFPVGTNVAKLFE
jgi:hypothetical protein